MLPFQLDFHPVFWRIRYKKIYKNLFFKFKFWQFGSHGRVALIKSYRRRDFNLVMLVLDSSKFPTLPQLPQKMGQNDLKIIISHRKTKNVTHSVDITILFKLILGTTGNHRQHY